MFVSAISATAVDRLVAALPRCVPCGSVESFFKKIRTNLPWSGHGVEYLHKCYANFAFADFCLQNFTRL